jgi:preprotein translocase subunit Sec61beta
MVPRGIVAAGMIRYMEFEEMKKSLTLFVLLGIAIAVCAIAPAQEKKVLPDRWATSPAVSSPTRMLKMCAKSPVLRRSTGSLASSCP